MNVLHVLLPRVVKRPLKGLGRYVATEANELFWFRAR